MPSEEPSDVELMVRFAERGDRAAFDELIERHHRSVIHTIARLVGDAATAEDLAQEVFLNIFRAGPTYEPRAEFRTWLFRIVRNVCYSEFRRQSRHPVFLEGSDEEGSALDVADEHAADPFEKLQKDERGRLVRAAIEKLPPAQRLALILRRYEGMSYEQIAGAMDNTVSGVKSLLIRAKAGLAATLARHFRP